MGRRRPYSLVLIGARKEEARTKYLAFLAGRANRPSRIGTNGNRPASVALGIEPFGRDLPTGVLARASASVDALTAFSDSISVTGRVKLAPGTTRTGYTAAAADTDFLKIADFTPARVIRRTYESATATPRPSEITGLIYGYRKSKSLSAPIGKENATDTLADALTEAVADIETANGLVQVFLKDEEV
jgi:hypothetical protein